MRTAISLLGVLAALILVGACFDPTRQCSTSSDCVNGGTCDPGTKTCVAAGNPNDKTAPVFSIVVTPPPDRQGPANLTLYDPGSPDGGRDAFRRDESVRVTVTSVDQDVDAGSVQLLAHGVSGSPGAALVVQLVACDSGNPAASNPFCREGTVQLASLQFEAFRAVAPLEVSGSDLSSNLGKADAGVNVTRWKWRYSAGAPIYTTPAIADDGTIVFGTSDGGSGSVYALMPDGSEKWTRPELGPMKASAILGSADGGHQFVYVATAASTGKMLALDVSDGAAVATCPTGTAFYAGGFMGTGALVTSGPSAFEGALGLASGSKLVNIRPTATGADPTCITTDSPATQGFASNIVVAGADAFVATAEGLVRAFMLDSGNWVKNPSWGGGLGYVGVGDRSIQSVALTSLSVVGTTSLKGIFELERGAGSLQASFPPGGLTSDPGGVLLMFDAGVFGDGQSPAPLLYSVSTDLTTGTTGPLGGALLGTPVAGSGGMIYVASSNGSIEARRGALALVWTVSLGSSESFLGSPTIGCSGRPADTEGVLYLPSVTGNLFSVVVDSPGLDPTAPWPKYQHDVRNTGNPTTPIQSCP